MEREGHFRRGEGREVVEFVQTGFCSLRPDTWGRGEERGKQDGGGLLIIPVS